MSPPKDRRTRHCVQAIRRRSRMPDNPTEADSSFPPNPVGQSTFARYTVAIGAVVLGWAAREALTPLWGQIEVPFIFFYPAIVVAALYGRIRPALLALGLSMLAADWFFIEPIHTFTISTFRDVATLAAFVFSSVLIIAAVEAMHRAKARALAEVTERERVEAELARVRGTFAKAFGNVGDVAGALDRLNRSPFLNADARSAKVGTRLIAPIFVAAALLLVGSTIFVYRVGLIRIRAQDRMANQLLVLQQLDDFLSSLKDTETGQRGYLLTGDEPYLQPYNNVRAQLQTKLDGLRRLARSGDLPQEKVEQVATLTQKKLSELEQTIQLRHDNGLDATLAIVRDNQGKRVMDEIRAGIGEMRADEEKEFAAAGRRAEWAADLRTQTFIGACLLNLLFLGWAFRKISGEVRHRERAILETGQQKELLATTLASIGDAVIVTDAKGNVTSLNAEAERLTGWTTAEASGKLLASVFHIVDEQTRQPAENPVEKVLRLGTVTGLANHTVLIAKDGREITIDDSAAPIRQAGGPLFGIVLVFRDFTERKQHEQRLAKQARLLNLGSDAIVLSTWENSILYWNRGAEELYGFTRDEAVGQVLHELLRTEFPQPHSEILAKVEQEGVWSGEIIHTSRDGRRITVAARWVVDRDAQGRPRTILKAFNDITERKQVERALRESQDRLSGLINSAMDAVIAVDAEQRIVLFNPAAERMFGYTASDVIGSSLDRLIPAELRNAHRAHIENFGLTGTTTRRMGALGALSGVRSNGDEFPIEASISHMTASGQKLFTVILRDISEREAAEAEREALLASEHELRQLAEETNRLKDEFLAIMSHELRNPLNVILGYSELLVRSDEITQSSQLQRMAEAIKRNAVAQSKLIRDLLDLSRLRSGKLELNRETVSMMVSVNNAIDTVRSEAEAKQIAIEIVAPGDALFVEGDPVRLQQIIWNLLNNSVKFTPAGGRISVRVGKEKDEVVLTVEDTGQGIDPSFLPHMFELFRQADGSTSRAQSGMGIGLAVVQQLIDLHQGSITAHSAGSGKGAAFTVKLPLSLEIKPELAPVLDLTTTLDNIAVLVVDDSEDTTEMLVHLLRISGAIVTSATSGDEALRIMAEKEFDVVLSDISMPGMDGFEFLRRLRQLSGNQDVPVLALTGFGRPEDVERAETEGFFSHVTKPFELESLMGVLQRLPKKRSGDGQDRSMN